MIIRKNGEMLNRWRT